MKIKMNSSNQVRQLYWILMKSSDSKKNPSQILEFANQLYEIFKDEADYGWEDKDCYEDRNFKDIYSLMSGYENAMMYQERELLDDVYESEMDFFATKKAWNLSNGRYA